MRHSYLIDGYNLIHALGMIQRNLAPGGLEASRRRLLDFLAESFGNNASSVTIVFDAKHAPPGVQRTQSHHGLHILFAPRNQSADDLIETLIDAETNPSELTVISNDQRLQNAAHREKAHAWSHEDLLDFLEKRQAAAPPAAAADEKSDLMSPEEMRRWLKEFEPLERDPELKEFFDLDRFED
jgi:predicted RNA-binding protein with PIN domain